MWPVERQPPADGQHAELAEHRQRLQRRRVARVDSGPCASATGTARGRARSGGRTRGPPGRTPSRRARRSRPRRPRRPPRPTGAGRSSWPGTRRSRNRIGDEGERPARTPRRPGSAAATGQNITTSGDDAAASCWRRASAPRRRTAGSASGRPVDARHHVADRQLVVAGEVELVEVAVDRQAQVVLEVDADLGAEVAAGVVGR